MGKLATMHAAVKQVEEQIHVTRVQSRENFKHSHIDDGLVTAPAGASSISKRPNQSAQFDEFDRQNPVDEDFSRQSSVGLDQLRGKTRL